MIEFKVFLSDTENEVITRLGQLLENKRNSLWKQFAKELLKYKNEDIKIIENKYTLKTRAIIQLYFEKNGKHWYEIGIALSEIKQYIAIDIISKVLSISERNTLMDHILLKRITFIYDNYKNDEESEHKIWKLFYNEVYTNKERRKHNKQCKIKSERIILEKFSRYSDDKGRRIYDWTGIMSLLIKLEITRSRDLIQKRILKLLKDNLINASKVFTESIKVEDRDFIDKSFLTTYDVSGIKKYMNVFINKGENYKDNELYNSKYTILDFCNALYYIGNNKAYNYIASIYLNPCYKSFSDRERSCGFFIMYTVDKISNEIEHKDLFGIGVEMNKVLESFTEILWRISSPKFRSIIHNKSTRIRWDKKYFIETIMSTLRNTNGIVPNIIRNRMKRTIKTRKLLKLYEYSIKNNKKKFIDLFYNKINTCNFEWDKINHKFYTNTTFNDVDLNFKSSYIREFIKYEKNKWSKDTDEKSLLMQEYDSWKYVEMIFSEIEDKLGLKKLLYKLINSIKLQLKLSYGISLNDKSSYVAKVKVIGSNTDDVFMYNLFSHKIIC